MSRLPALLLALVLALPMPALALSCAPWSPTRAFVVARDSAEAYVVVSGVLVFDESRMPRAARPGSPGPVVLPATFTGRALTRAGFTATLATDLVLSVSCLGAWCGDLASGDAYLAFLRQATTGYVLDVGPCAAMAFGGPAAALEQAITTCLTGGRCLP